MNLMRLFFVFVMFMIMMRVIMTLMIEVLVGVRWVLVIMSMIVVAVIVSQHPRRDEIDHEA